MKKHIYIKDKKKCCGCTACASKCPKNAIKMKEDNEGFLYPKVSAKLCVDCGLCIEACPIINGNHTGEKNNVYAVKNKSDKVRAQSSSGGIFSAIAEFIEGKNGVIYGAAYDENFSVKHIRTEKNDWKKLRGSKYVQSDINGVFQELKRDLNMGRYVLFTGTPCQVDGLKHYLNKDETQNLITIDLICHAVPSPKIWREYLSYVEEKRGLITSVNFRNKENYGWHKSTLRIMGMNDEIIIDEKATENHFFKMFFNHLSIRPSCFECQYSNFKRVGDITIGDYWGIEKHYPAEDDDKGTSLVFINTEKGNEIFKSISKQCTIFPITIDQAIQPPLMAPAPDFGGRKEFWEKHNRKSFEELLQCYMSPAYSKSVKTIIKRTLKKFSKFFIRY